MTTPPEYTPQSMVMVRIGGREYPLRREPSCDVCSSPYRFDIERALTLGHSYRMIREALTDREPGPPSIASISNHVSRSHMPLPQATTRRLIEHRAEQLGREIEEGTEILVDAVTVNEEIIRKGFTRLQDGEIEPNMGELLQALKLQRDIDATAPSGDLSAEAWTEALMEFFTIAHQVMPPAVWERFTQETAKSAILKAFAAKRQAIPGQVEE